MKARKIVSISAPVKVDRLILCEVDPEATSDLDDADRFLRLEILKHRKDPISGVSFAAVEG
jgi:hypothetical protein